MATMVATANASELQTRIREAQLKVREAEQELEGVLHEISGDEELLSQLQSERMGECIELARGQKADPSGKFDKRIQQLRDRISGLERLKARREREVADRRVTVFDLNSELSRIEQEKAIRAEGDATRQLIGSIETAIEDRNRSQRMIEQGVKDLRARKYLTESTRRMGLDSAERLERKSCGLR